MPAKLDPPIAAPHAPGTPIPDEPTVHHELDITAAVCPMTFVRTRLALDRMDSGQVLAVLLKGTEPRTNVPASAQELGHAILALQDLPGGTARLLIRKK